MSTFAERVRTRREELHLTQGELARLAGMKQSTIATIESGRNKTTRALTALAQALQCSSSWLELGTGSLEPTPTPNVRPSARPVSVWSNEDELSQEEYFFVPKLDLRVSAGTGHLAWEIEQRGQRQAMTRSWANRTGVNPADLVTVQAQGDSMLPRIQDGDSLTIDVHPAPIRDGSIYVFILDDEWYVKRLYKQVDGSLLVRSDNGDGYKDILIPQERAAAIQIVGRVLAISGPAY